MGKIDNAFDNFARNGRTKAQKVYLTAATAPMKYGIKAVRKAPSIAKTIVKALAKG